MKTTNRQVTSKILSIIAIGLSILAILFSITSLSNKQLEADWASVLVGVLGAMSTILIGWQLYNVIGFEKRMSDLEDRLESDVETRGEVILSSVNSSIRVMAETFLLDGNKTIALKQIASNIYRTFDFYKTFVPEEILQEELDIILLLEEKWEESDSLKLTSYIAQLRELSGLIKKLNLSNSVKAAKFINRIIRDIQLQFDMTIVSE